MSEIINKEILHIADAIYNERGISKDIIFDAITEALETAAIKQFEDDIDVKVEINIEDGTYKTYKIWTVVTEDELVDGNKQIELSRAQKQDSSLQLGDIIKEEIPSVSFGRIGVQVAKNIIIKKIREAERAKLTEVYSSKVGQLVVGEVRRVTRDTIFVELLPDNAEAILKRDQLIPKEAFRIGDRVRAYLQKVDTTTKGPALILSRTDDRMLVELFKIEVPEINEDIIEIKAVARDPGSRAKIAVKTNDGRVDPVGACVGMRGSRVQAVSTELKGERIDIVLWDDDLVQFIINSMAPAEVVSVVVDEENNQITVTVADEHLSQAIGRNGQNVILASKLSGWRLKVVSESEQDTVSESDYTAMVNLFIEALDIDEDFADLLVQSGITSLEDIINTSVEELLVIEDLDEETVEELKNRANEYLTKQSLLLQEKYKGVQPAEDLLNLEGMTQELAYKLASKEIVTQEDLAECAVDELLEVCDELNKDKAAKLILEARKPWFS